jgi:uncharacterized protein GlcG (DUF336 family)
MYAPSGVVCLLDVGPTRRCHNRAVRQSTNRDPLRNKSRSVSCEGRVTRCRPPWSTRQESSRSSSKATTARSTRRLLAFATPICSSLLGRSSTWTRPAKSRSLNPAGSGPALTSIPNVLALAGGVAIKRNNEIVAALGVGSSPSGAKDEACAEAGVAETHDRLEAAAAPMGRSTDGKK